MAIFRYLIKRIFTILCAIWLVATLTFVLMKAIPGDPFTEDKVLNEEILLALQRHYGLDKPWYVQYIKYMKGIATLDLGPSYKYEGRRVTDIIGFGFPVSALLGAQAIFLALAFGVFLGSWGAMHHLRWQDETLRILSVFGISVPSFLVATFLQYLLAVKLQVLPIARWGTFSHTILPTLSLAALPTAFIARLIRASLIEVLQEDYILTAYSKGLSRSRALARHALKNALIPVITYLGPLTATVLTGSFVVEKIFGIPGLGQWLVTSVFNRDYTVILGIAVFYSAILMSCTLFVDIAYCCIDPRITLEQKRRMK